MSEEDQQEIEVYNEGLSYFGGTSRYLGPRDHTDTEKNTPEYGDPDKYAFTKIDLGDRSAESAWDILTQAHQQFSTSGTNINYDIQKNSNSYATTLLSVIGVDIADYADKAKPKSVISFPGQGVNVLGNSDDAISLNLQGRDEYGDIIRTGVKDDSLSGLAGSDELSGGGGNDVLRGGAGMDTLDPPFCDAIE